MTLLRQGVSCSRGLARSASQLTRSGPCAAHVHWRTYAAYTPPRNVIFGGRSSTSPAPQSNGLTRGGPPPHAGRQAQDAYSAFSPREDRNTSRNNSNDRSRDESDETEFDEGMDETNFEGRSLRSKEAFIRSRLDKNRVYRNEAIPFPYVQLKHPSARNLPGMMHPPAPLSALLPLLAEGNYLELTAHTPYVVVEYRNHAAEVEQARKKKGAPKAPETKEIQLTWAVSDGDLSHKLEKTRSSLLEGARVDLVFGPKKRTPLPTPERREEILTKSLELLTDVAVERSPRKDEKLMSSLFLQRNPSISVADAAKLKPQKEMSGLEAYLASHGST